MLLLTMELDRLRSHVKADEYIPFIDCLRAEPLAIAKVAESLSDGHENRSDQSVNQWRICAS